MDPATSSQPATADRGSFTTPEPLQNTYTTDANLRRLLSWYLPSSTYQSIQSNLTQLGEEAISPQIREWSADAERHQPYVKGYNVWGQRYDYDRLITSEGWKQLSRWGARHGVVALGYDPSYGASRRLVQYTVNYLYGPSSGLTSCPVAMTDGAALILSQQLQQHSFPEDHPFRVVFNHLTSRNEDFWTSGQWMTERAGGSDVQNTETWATHDPLPVSTTSNNNPLGTLGEGEYSISGFKFFSSATDANVTLLLAKTAPSGKLSTFLAPSDAPSPPQPSPREVTNGVRIHRLKTKLGTKELPTAELELRDMRAHLVGQRDKGVATIAPLLNVTRTHTFIGSLGAWRRALSIARSFSRARSTVGEPLWLIPMHLRLLAEVEVRQRAAMQLGFFTVGVMGVVENPDRTDDVPGHVPRGNEATVVFRALTAVSKAVISKMAILGIQECQEAMGGVGYMDEPDEPEFNVSRIWEGTTNVLASEMVRFLLARDNFAVFAGWVERVLGMIRREKLARALGQAWTAFKGKVARNVASVLADGRRVMFTLAWILMGHGDAVAAEVARRWILAGEGGVGDTVYRDIVKPYEADGDEKDHARWDCRIVWGQELPEVQVAGHRSLKKNKL
ncbi:putative acyl-CoA dehydrogenase [Aspergillus novofumigatus IBT 16806]|uniref:Putative acyl-CoA dehydrogenase n=1 Tax=Aspergillus novofumigatus (strain IBT 16806) TaxID=1392255 RepID=A0A2I1CI40_ASPN1|nr:putative acyl-CoA dehydrogenase [Aspergillus novofumigatus IBT 16806]PKX97270.1 putative acyl-CoA dehydrogenase [Aspergillus novofumigatus IBT 16806]